MKRLRAIIAAALLAGVASVTGIGLAQQPAAAAPVICEKFGSTSIQNGQYIVQNNLWGADTAQCIDVNQSGGFTVTQANHNKATNGAPASYPSIYAGCHYNNCTSGPMPIQISQISSATSSIGLSYPSSGTWNAAYDIWLDPTARRDGQNGLELMIWLNRQGSIQPIGSPIGNVTIAGRNWEVWYGNTGWHVVSYVSASPVSSYSFSVQSFINDVVSRGYITNSWYLTSIQAGFEPWIGGAGLAVNSFSAAVNGGGGGGTQPPPAPTNLRSTGSTANSVSLAWDGASGATGYQILRATGTSGGTFTQVGTASGTSFTNTGLSASTTYRYQVRATNSAGQSPVSNTVTTTTQSGGGGGGGSAGCSATVTVQSQWPGGYVLQVAVRNTGTSPIGGWTVTGTLPSGHQVTNSWNATVTTSGQTLTGRNLSWNGSLGAGQQAEWGLQASRSGGNPPTSLTCTAS